MKWEFICVVEDEELVSYQTDHEVAAQALLGALNLDYHDCGCVEMYFFTDAELCAAESALAIAINVPPMFTEGLVFLTSVREELKRRDVDCCHILIS